MTYSRETEGQAASVWRRQFIDSGKDRREKRDGAIQNRRRKQGLFLETLRQKLPEQNNIFRDNQWNLMIDKEIPVPYRHIYFPLKNELEICCFKQDICIYTKMLDRSIGHREAAITANGAEVLKVVLNKNAPNDKDIGLPFVIIETKMSENLETHTILAYSEKTKMIKSIFPYCRAYLLCFGRFRRNIYRHGSGFDDLFCLENLNDKNCEFVIQKIAGIFNDATNRIAVAI